MCPMASLFDLIEGPCKSIWNSPVEVDLLSSAIFKVPLFTFQFWIILDYLCFTWFALFCDGYCRRSSFKEEKERNSNQGENHLSQ